MADNKHDQAATVSRRSAMQAGAAAALATGAMGVPLFWSGAAWADKAKIDSVLSGAVSAGNVPGVVALAADDKGVFYEGAFGKRNLASGAAMTNADAAVRSFADAIAWIGGRFHQGLR